MNAGILYGMCWEDPEIFTALVSENDKVLSVCSGGDIALSALTKNPAMVVVVDTNQDQLNLCNTKAKYFEGLDYESCHHKLGTFNVTKQSIIQQGKFERYMRSFVRFLLPLAVGRSEIQRFLDSKDLTEQKRIYEQHVNNARYRFLFRRFFGRMTMRRYGRHPDLLKHVKANIAQVLYQRMQHAWTEVPISKNYFFRFILEGKFQDSLNLPHWAKKTSFENIKKNVSKLDYQHRAMHDFLSSTDQKFQTINLSNITETMTSEAADSLFALARKRIAPDGFMLIWNTMVDRKPVDGWQLDKERSAAFWAERNTSFYGFLGVYNPI